MSGDVTLTAALRTNLNSLSNTSNLIDRTSQRLSTGKEVNSVFDDPVNFAQSESFNNRSSDLDSILDNISQSKRTVEQAQNGAEAVEGLVNEAESLLNQADQEFSKGDGRASVTGTSDLSGIDDTQNVFTGAMMDATLDLTITDEDGNDQTRNVNLNDSAMTIDQLVANIDAKDGVSASLDDSGQLQLEATNDGSPLRISFTADSGGSGNELTEQEIANELGLDSFVRVEDDGAGGSRVAGTTTSGTTLTSVTLTQMGSNDLAEASSGLDGLEDGDGNTIIVGNEMGDTVNFEVTAKDGSSLATADATELMTGSVQEVVDNINNSDAGEYIRASFDADSGQLSISAIDDQVDAVSTQVTDDGTAGDAEFNAGFDGFAGETTGAGSPGAGNTVDQAIRFGATAGQIKQIEANFDTVRQQIDNAVGEAELSGTNLLNGDNLQTFFNTERTESLTTQGVSFTSNGLGLEEANFSSSSQIQEFRSSVIDAKSDVRGFNQRITTDLNVIQTREDLANNTQETLSAASDDLTLADQNEEAAKLSALQTRQQLANQSLSIAVQSQQSVLQILR